VAARIRARRFRINTFSDDYRLMAQLWEHYIQGFIDNSAGVGHRYVPTQWPGEMSLDYAGYFFDEEILLSNDYYFSDSLGDFKISEHPDRLEPAPLFYDVRWLPVSPYCVSACEGFANAMSQGNADRDRAYLTAGLWRRAANTNCRKISRCRSRLAGQRPPTESCSLKGRVSNPTLLSR
jgi:hypothetical protein